MLMEGFNNDDLEVHLQKVDPNWSGSLEHFPFLRWCVDKEVSLDFTEEAEYLVGWGYKASLMDIQWEIFMKVN